MFGLITKRRLLHILKKLADNNDSENATNLQDFYWRCGNENAINYICSQLKIDFNA